MFSGLPVLTLNDGRVYKGPTNVALFGQVYDPVANTLTTPAGSYPGGKAFLVGCRLADGRIFMAPYNADSPRIYDPVAGTVTKAAGYYPDVASFTGAVLLTDGRVFMVPHFNSEAVIYNPATDTNVAAAGITGSATAIPLSGQVIVPANGSATIPIQGQRLLKTILFEPTSLAAKLQLRAEVGNAIRVVGSAVELEAGSHEPNTGP